ncbi:DUF2147 domain-containing protein [Francisellaceae bacterium]|nr:DUF2147 domain-containing protein [Francisellaceae bacterium]
MNKVIKFAVGGLCSLGFTLGFSAAMLDGVKNDKLDGNSYWATVSDDNVDGKPVIQSIVEISATSSGDVKGEVLVPFVKIVDNQAQVPQMICTECNGDLKNKPIMGLNIINAKSSGEEYKGNIIDPTSGKDYSLKMWLSDKGNVLNVRGYIMFFYRTQYWYHVDSKIAQQCLKWFQGQAYAKQTDESSASKTLASGKYTFFTDKTDPTATTKALSELCQ